MRRSMLMLFAVTALVVAMISPASGITRGGELAGDDYPNVVLLLMDVGGQPAYRCTATMIAPTVALTAGHCTSNYPDDPFTGMRIFYESDVDGGDNNYPFPGPNTIEATSWEAHPDYEKAPFFFNDVGVVHLSAPIPNMTEFGALPDTAGALNALKTSGKKAQFTSVGYGLQAAQLNNPTPQQHTVSNRVRMVAKTRLIQINVPGSVGDFAMILTNNAKTGGTCFGDSGGPNFLGDTNVIAGITSFGTNANCAGIGGVFRTDRADVLEFVNSHLGS